MTNQKRRFKEIVAGLLAGLVLTAAPAAAGSPHGDKTAGHGDKAMGHAVAPAEFKQELTAEGIRAEFQIMRLDSVNTKDPKGATHHVMVKFFDAASGAPIKDAMGKVKVIAPSKAEAVEDLKDYSGTYAANVTLAEPGAYGIICLAKVKDQKPLFKFWYTRP